MVIFLRWSHLPGFNLELYTCPLCAIDLIDRLTLGIRCTTDHGLRGHNGQRPCQLSGAPNATIARSESLRRKSWTIKEVIFAQWRLFIFISRESKWGTLKNAGNPRCAVPAESHSICTDWRRPGPAAGLQVSPTSDTCQSVVILMNRRHLTFSVTFLKLNRHFGLTSGVPSSHFSGGRIFNVALRTVKPVLSDHPTVQGKLFRSTVNSTVANVAVRTRSIYAMIIHVNLVQAVASCGCFLQTCVVVAVLTGNVGSKQRFSLLLIAKDREIWPLVQKNAGRWPR